MLHANLGSLAIVSWGEGGGGTGSVVLGLFVPLGLAEKSCFAAGEYIRVREGEGASDEKGPLFCVRCAFCTLARLSVEMWG